VIQLTGLTRPYLCAIPKPGPEFPTSYNVMVFFFLLLMYNDLG
jgi:hypothetical protein